MFWCVWEFNIWDLRRFLCRRVLKVFVKSFKTAKKRSWLRYSEKVRYWLGKGNEMQLWTFLRRFKRKGGKGRKRDRKTEKRQRKAGKETEKACVRDVCTCDVCTGVYVMRVRVWITYRAEKVKKILSEKFLKFLLTAFTELCIMCCVRWCERLKNKFEKTWKNLLTTKSQ